MTRLAIEQCSPTSVRLNGRDLLAFGGCNYLGLGSHPRVLDALRSGLDRWGLSTTASRETTGNTVAHDALERELADFMQQEACILSAEGYTANFMAMQTLAREHRVCLIDAQAHRSIRHAAVASGMQVFEYEHCSSASALWLVSQFADQGVVIATDSVFAADGAIAPLPDLLACLPLRRASLLVDDCHGFCVLGVGGRGAVHHHAMQDPRVIITTTLAKGLGCYGGAVLGTRAFVDAVQDRAWVYRGSTPIPPAMAEACRSALRVLQESPELITRLRENIALMRQNMFFLGLPQAPDGVPIFTFAVSPDQRQDAIHEMLREAGLFVPVISYPGGPAERYFRVVVNACHSAREIDMLGRELSRTLDVTREGQTDRRAAPQAASQIESRPTNPAVSL